MSQLTTFWILHHLGEHLEIVEAKSAPFPFFWIKKSGEKRALKNLYKKSVQHFKLVPKTFEKVICTFKHFLIEEIRGGEKVLSTFQYHLCFFWKVLKSVEHFRGVLTTIYILQTLEHIKQGINGSAWNPRSYRILTIFLRKLTN